MNAESKVYIAGHRGLVGSAIMRNLQAKGYNNLVYRTSAELDLRNQADVNHFFQEEKPEYVFMAAAKVGGIISNSTYPADFIRDNLMIQTNVIDAAFQYGAKKLLFLGSTCIYPKFSPQPMKEEYLLTGELEETNEHYAIAKIAGVKMCEAYNRQFGTNFISVMPTNLYGINDNFDLKNSHVLPALIRKFHEAKINSEPSVEVWGTGNPKREFLYSEDLADAVVHVMHTYSGSELINIGVGKDIAIKQLAEQVKEIVGYTGDIFFNTSKPDGAPRKLVEISKLTELGWEAKTTLEEGLKLTYDWFLQTVVEKNLKS